MDGYVVVVPSAKVTEWTEDMGHTMLLREMEFFEPKQAAREDSGLDVG